MLPGVNIILGNGAVGGQASGDDGIVALILTGVTVAGVNKVTVGEANQLFGLADAVALGIDDGGTNDFAYQEIKDAYLMAGEGTEIWVMLCLNTVTMEDMLDPQGVYAPVLLDAANGSIKLLGVSANRVATAIADGLDEDVDKAFIKGQVLADAYANNFSPFRFIVDCKDWSGTLGDLKDYHTAAFNRGAPLIASNKAGVNASVGLLIGDLASLPVQRKVSRVKNGALPISEAYLTDNKTSDSHKNEWDALHDKGYIFFRSFVGRSGYFVSDDPTATALTDDYSSLARGRVIDKALRIAYDVYVEEIGDEIEVDDDGKILPTEAKDLQGRVETAINTRMVNNGEATAVEAYIDLAQDVIATGKLNIVLRVQPVGYKDFIEILLGFENPANSN